MKAALEAHGLSIWLDLEDIQSGDWKARITNVLNPARALVFLMTPDTLAAGAVQKELRLASAEGVDILSVQIADPADETTPDWHGFEFDSIHQRTPGPQAARGGDRRVGQGQPRGAAD